MYYSPSPLPEHIRWKMVENPADLKSFPSEPIIDDHSDSEIRDLVTEEKDLAIDPDDASSRKRHQQTAGKRSTGLKKAKVSAADIADTLLEDVDHESNHANGGNIEVVEVPVQKPSAPENPTKVAVATIKPGFRFKKAVV